MAKISWKLVLDYLKFNPIPINLTDESYKSLSETIKIDETDFRGSLVFLRQYGLVGKQTVYSSPTSSMEFLGLTPNGFKVAQDNERHRDNIVIQHSIGLFTYFLALEPMKKAINYVLVDFGVDEPFHWTIILLGWVFLLLVIWGLKRYWQMD